MKVIYTDEKNFAWVNFVKFVQEERIFLEIISQAVKTLKVGVLTRDALSNGLKMFPLKPNT